MALGLPPRRDMPVRLDNSLAVVNIVLLLLFFFLSVGQDVRPADDMALSVTDALPLEDLPRPILVVRSADEWELDGSPISPELVPAAVAGPVLHLMIDKDARAGLLIATLENPVLAGYDLRLVTLREAALP